MKRNKQLDDKIEQSVAIIEASLYVASGALQRAQENFAILKTLYALDDAGIPSGVSDIRVAHIAPVQARVIAPVQARVVAPSAPIAPVAIAIQAPVVLDDTDWVAELGKILNAARIRSDMSLRGVQDAVGLIHPHHDLYSGRHCGGSFHASSISTVERGFSIPGVRQLTTLFRVYKMTKSEIAGIYEILPPMYRDALEAESRGVSEGKPIGPRVRSKSPKYKGLRACGTEWRKRVGAILRARREELGFSGLQVIELCDKVEEYDDPFLNRRIGAPRQIYIHQYESGVATLGIRQLPCLVRALDMNMDQIHGIESHLPEDYKILMAHDGINLGDCAYLPVIRAVVETSEPTHQLDPVQHVAEAPQGAAVSDVVSSVFSESGGKPIEVAHAGGIGVLILRIAVIGKKHADWSRNINNGAFDPHEIKFINHDRPRTIRRCNYDFVVHTGTTNHVAAQTFAKMNPDVPSMNAIGAFTNGMNPRVHSVNQLIEWLSHYNKGLVGRTVGA